MEQLRTPVATLEHVLNQTLFDNSDEARPVGNMVDQDNAAKTSDVPLDPAKKI